MTSQTYTIPPSLPGLVFLGFFFSIFFFPNTFFAIEDTPKHETLFRSRSRGRERGGADAYVPARLEIHELLNIGVNLYADTNGASPDELYIADANRRRDRRVKSTRNSKVWPQWGMCARRTSRHKIAPPKEGPDIKFHFMPNG